MRSELASPGGRRTIDDLPVDLVHPAEGVLPVGRVIVDLADRCTAGLRALAREPMLRATGLASTLAAFGWGLMMLGFPIYASRILHTGTHTSGYMWAAVAGGSIIGTFALRGAPSRRRIAGSYAALGVSALLWPLVHALALGGAAAGAIDAAVPAILAFTIVNLLAAAAARWA